MLDDCGASSSPPDGNAMEKLKQLFGVRKNMACLLCCCTRNLDIYFSVGLKIVKLFTYIQIKVLKPDRYTTSELHCKQGTLSSDDPDNKHGGFFYLDK